MRLACFEDFEQEGGLYWPAYHDHPYFAERAVFISRSFLGARVLLAGCGWGFTVRRAHRLGVDIWGCDASPYALAKAHSLMPKLAEERIMLVDVLQKDSLAALGKFDVVLTEDMLPMLELGEIPTALHNLRSMAPAPVYHWVTPRPVRHDPHTSIPSSLSMDEWRDLTWPDQVIQVGDL